MKIKLLVLLFLSAFTFTAFGQRVGNDGFEELDETERNLALVLQEFATNIKEHYYAGNYAETISLSKKALQISKNTNPLPHQFEIRSFLGNTYLRLDDLTKAESEFKENLSEAKMSDNEEAIMGATIDLGNLYRLQKKPEKAISTFLEAGIIAEKRNDSKRIFIINYNIAEIYIIDEKNYSLATNYINKAEEHVGKLDIFFEEAFGIIKGYYYLNSENVEKSIFHFEKSISSAKKFNHIDELTNAYAGLVDAYELAGNDKASLRTYKLLDSLKRKQFSIDKEEYKQNIDIKQQNEQIKQKLKSSQLENALIKERIFRNNIVFYGVLLVIIVLSILLFSLWKASKKRRKLILDLKHKNEKYLEAKEQSEKLAKAKSKFFSTITHDLRTPLYGIIGLTNTLVDEPELKCYQHEIKTLKFSADYLLALINDLLHVNKIDSKKGAILDYQQFSIRQLMADLVESLQYMKTQNNNTLEVVFDEKIPNYVVGDRLRLSQILMNLMANALKFTHSGNIKTYIKTQKIVEDKISIKFEIEDDGIGIPKGKQELIFEEFHQIENTGTFHGTGLGLNIVSKLLNQMESKIYLESDGLKGSMFYFTIEFSLLNSPKESKTDNLLAENIKVLDGKKVLIVEDNIINQLVTKKILSKYKMDFDVANNGLEAVEFAHKIEYDLILMDINMPVMDGIIATEKIRVFNEMVPIILLTAVDLQDFDERFQNLKYDDVIIKPYAMNSFLGTLIKHF